MLQMQEHPSRDHVLRIQVQGPTLEATELEAAQAAQIGPSPIH
jgi:hypothetical protein